MATQPVKCRKNYSYGAKRKTPFGWK